MKIERINLRQKLDEARHSFDNQLAQLLLGRPDLSHAQVQKEFGIGEKVIRRVMKQFNLGARRRGPKPKAALEPMLDEATERKQNENMLGGRVMKHLIAQLRLVSLLSFVLLALTTAFGQITPSGDAYTNTVDPTTNYGAKILLDVDAATQTTYIQFNLASIPATYTSADITKATLKLYVNTVLTAGSFNVDYVNGTWAESTITSSLAPALGTTIAASVPITTADKNQFILIDVTAAVQAWLSGTANDGIALVANGTFNATFDSKENTATSHAPELDLVFASGTLSGVTTASGSGLTGGGTSGTLNLGLLTTCASGQVLEWKGSAWACATASGTGTVTSVASGAGLTGGTITASGTLSIDTTKVPLLASANTFTANQTITGTGAVGNYGLTVNQPSQTGILLEGPVAGVGAGLDLLTTGTGGKQWEILATGSTSSQGVGKLNIRDVNTGTNVLTIDASDNVNVNTNLNVAGGTITFTGNQSVAGNIAGGTSSSSTEGVLGEANAASGGTIGVAGLAVSPSGYGVEGLNLASGGIGVYGNDSAGTGVHGTGTYGVYGTGTNYGVYASGGTYGVYASGGTYGVYASGGTYGVYATGTLDGVYGAGAEAPSGSGLDGGIGIYASGGNGDPSSSTARPGSGGIFSGASGSSCSGILCGGDGIEAIAGSGYAGYFGGNVNVTGAVTAGTKDFKIDHPLDPANKYLFHASVESSEMMNIYTGNVTTDGQGLATVQLPDWFEALNTDFRYQLTVIGQFAQAIVSSKVASHQFGIRTDKPNVEVSWQITGVRQDAYAKAHPLVVEQAKDARERGHYIHPELYGAPEEQGIDWARHPAMMKQMQGMRARQLAAAQGQTPTTPAETLPLAVPPTPPPAPVWPGAGLKPPVRAALQPLPAQPK